MAAQIESVHKLPDMGDHGCPPCIAVDNSHGRERILVGDPDVGGEPRVFRIDLAADTCETFSLPGISYIRDIGAAAEGGYYLVSDWTSLHRLDYQMAIIASTTEPDAGILSIAAADYGFVAIVKHRGAALSPGRRNKPYHSLARYSASLEQQWQIELPKKLLPDNRRSGFSPVIPLIAPGVEHFYVVAAREGASCIEVRGRGAAPVIHDLPTFQPADAGWIAYEGNDYLRQPEYLNVSSRSTVRLMPVFWDACSRPSDNALILVDWCSLLTRGGERQEQATLFYDFRLKETRASLSILKGSFMFVTALSGNRIAAVGRLAIGSDWVVAVIRLPPPDGNYPPPLT